MENKTFNRIIGASIILVILIAAFILIKPSVSAYSSISIEKCESSSSDDCWHALAHKALNTSFCYEIEDGETRSHCLEHIPEVN